MSGSRGFKWRVETAALIEQQASLWRTATDAFSEARTVGVRHWSELDVA